MSYQRERNTLTQLRNLLHDASVLLESGAFLAASNIELETAVEALARACRSQASQLAE